MSLVRAFNGSVGVGQLARFVKTAPLSAVFCFAHFSSYAFAQISKQTALPANTIQTPIKLAREEELGDSNGKNIPSWRSQPDETQEKPASRILPLQSGFRSFDGSTLGFGAIREFPQFRTKKKYRGDGLGFVMSFDQKIKGPWSGGIQGRWSQWVPHEESGPLEPVSPVSAVSRIEFSPSLSPVAGAYVGSILKPYAVGGIGYVTFMKYLGLPLKRDKQEASEPIATFGGGVRLVWPGQAALRFSAERWRGLRSFDISVMSYQLEVQFGDVSR